MAFNFFTKLKESLGKTSSKIASALGALLPFGANLTDDLLDEVEAVLYEADLGVAAVERLIAALRAEAGPIKRGETDPYAVMKRVILSDIDRFEGKTALTLTDAHPHVILVIGVNGVGKTTTIGKLAMRFASEGKSVLLAACDTFRAAAIDQLEIWAERSNATIIKAHPGADAASVAHDAIQSARNRNTDIVIIDTAGRLHTSFNLLAELKKIRRVIANIDPALPHETLLVLDATNGQNALSQAETFQRELAVSGIALTKLDGTAKGGIVVSIIDRLGIPVRLIGVGEGIDDLRDFEPEAYVEALFAR